MKRMLLAISVMLFMVGCSELLFGPPRYGVEFNEERKKIGLPILEHDWEIVNHGPDYVVWANPEREVLTRPHYRTLAMKYDQRGPIEQIDTYDSSQEYLNQTEASYESVYIAIEYRFRDTPGWRVRYNNADNAGDDYSLEQAEAILRAWGVERLNYR